MTTLYQLLVFFVAVFTQALAGFGSGLISMAFLPLVMPVLTAAPVVAMLTSSVEIFMLARLRTSFNFKAVAPLTLASLFGIPIGVWSLRAVDEAILLRTLGVVMAGYALYALLNLRLPELKHPLWTVVAGFTAGILSGAYSVGGPPVIIYGDCRRWKPDEFRSNLQGFFLANDVIVLVTHAFSGNLTPLVWRTYLLAVPMIALGLLAGTRLDKRLNPATFRKLVLGLLVVMGVRLIIAG